jgi:hypothetical protein
MQRAVQAGVALTSAECFVKRDYVFRANGVTIGKYKQRGE